MYHRTWSMRLIHVLFDKVIYILRKSLFTTPIILTFVTIIIPSVARVSWSKISSHVYGTAVYDEEPAHLRLYNSKLRLRRIDLLLMKSSRLDFISRR